jgi:hypothetical protein
VFETDLPSHSFLVNDMDHDVPCVFQIWEKQQVPRPVVDRMKPVGFAFVHKTQTPDISLRRVGVNAGTIEDEIQSKNINTHYFIRFTNQHSKHVNMAAISNISFLDNNTVGPKSISKQEVITVLNAHLSQYIG